MKPQELMIGDWVLHEDTPKKVDVVWGKAVSLNDPLKTWGSIYADKYYQGMEPIPLTPEILEKNGFINVYRGRYRFDDDKGSIVEISTVNNEIKWVRASKYDENIEEQLSNCTFNDMRFVHELQNVLKLCGIDKEIEL